MKNVSIVAAVVAVALLSSGISEAAISKPAPRPTNNAAREQSERDAAWERLRSMYPDLLESSDVVYVSDTSTPVPSGEYSDDDLYAELEGAPTEYDLRDAQLARHWIDVKEDLTTREIDKKALALVKQFAGAKNAVPPMLGQNGAVSYVFGDHIPRITCRVMRVTDIALQPGEKITSVHAGDTGRWQFLPAKSGAGDSETIHVIVKPLIPDISTNLVLMTDRRTYNLDLISSATEFIPSINFTYPSDVMAGWDAFVASTKRAEQQSNEPITLAEGNMSPDDLYFGYEITKGKSLPWAPLRVFDDGVKTYIELPAKYRSLEAPVLIYYEGKKEKLVNYRVKDRFYVVDRIMTGKAALIAGSSRVVIVRKKETGRSED